MPRNDGTGPFGDGRLGRGLGPCGRSETPARQDAGRGPGFRARGGFGFRGRGRCACEYYGYNSLPPIYTYTKEDLTAQKDELQQQLKWIDEQLNKPTDNK